MDNPYKNWMCKHEIISETIDFDYTYEKLDVEM